MKQIYISVFILFNLLCSGPGALAQTVVNPMHTFEDPALYNLQDSVSPRLAGVWLGQETEFLDQGFHVKGNFECKFALEQEGNKISGHSYISFDEGKNFAVMKIRGLVMGQTFYFEEFEIEKQGFSQAATLWCLRTGELSLGREGKNLVLEGNNYKAYADQYYFPCSGNVSWHMSCSPNAMDASSQKSISPEAPDNFQLKPNPADHEVNICFKLATASEVQIDLFNLAGKLITPVTHMQYTEGEHHHILKLNEYPPGVYLVRMLNRNQSGAALLVIQR
ncbi:MAG TPA: T9SS type A sorting domain-containing protein [Bacteroidia bacterium]|nr:T9SS type A sorting domain-containing protein [Bacteroidia bacterium]